MRLAPERSVLFLLAALLLWCVGAAQPNHQRLLDTAIVGAGVVGGYLTASGEHVLRMQFGPAMEVHRYAEDGTPIWWHRLAAEGVQWNNSVAASDGAEGAVVAGNPLVLDRETLDARLEVVHFALNGDGAVSASMRSQLALDPALASEFQPDVRIVNGVDQSIFLVIRSTSPGHPQLLLAKRDADGSIAWVRGLRDGSGVPTFWGDPGTMVCADGAGGLYVARRDPGAAATRAARVSSTGELLWMKRFTDAPGYTVSVFDIAASLQGELLVLGKMVGTGLPSGGLFLTISSTGSILAGELYQWDLGRRLYVLSDGSMATVKEPWVYRLDGAGAVLWAQAFEGWMIEPHQFVFETTNMQVEHGRLWMQGTLRRILIQFNTQRSLPGFITHPLDSIAGCQWEFTEGFTSVPLDVSTLQSLPIGGSIFQDLSAQVVTGPMEIEVTVPSRQLLIPFCDQVVGLPEELAASQELLSFPNPIERNGTLTIVQAIPGTYSIADVQGRSLWQQELRGPEDQFRVVLPNAAVGVHFLRCVPTNGAAPVVSKVLVY